VVGAGPAGLAAAVTAAERGHRVDLFEAADHIGGQFDLARRIPGKEEFSETIRYYLRRLEITGVRLYLGHHATADELDVGGYDEVILATGVRPRTPDIPGIDHPMVLSYPEAIREVASVGKRVAVIGAGGIGVDVSELLTHLTSPTLDLSLWQREWGVADPGTVRGAVTAAQHEPAPRTVYLLQRSDDRMGSRLGKTTGWIHRAALTAKGVQHIPGLRYEKIDDEGLHFHTSTGYRVLSVDNVVVCAGQESVRDLYDELIDAGIPVRLIGGADVAEELDAKRAIDQATRLAAAV
jgi:2,4-dienoyl-CoA reductase (NADPH2)